MACADCQQAAPTQEKQVAPDPCNLVTQSDATALFGGPAVKKQSGHDECLWGYDSPGHSSLSLRVQVRDIASLHEPDIVVMRTHITYSGHPDPDPPITQHVSLGPNGGLIEASNSDGVGVHWQHGDKYIIHLRMMWLGPSAPKPTAEIDPMKQLAQKVEAVLGG
jgi:hypothetical protein